MEERPDVDGYVPTAAEEDAPETELGEDAPETELGDGAEGPLDGFADEQREVAEAEQGPEDVSDSNLEVEAVEEVRDDIGPGGGDTADVTEDAVTVERETDETEPLEGAEMNGHGQHEAQVADIPDIDGQSQGEAGPESTLSAASVPPAAMPAPAVMPQPPAQQAVSMNQSQADLRVLQAQIANLTRLSQAALAQTAQQAARQIAPPAPAQGERHIDLGELNSTLDMLSSDLNGLYRHHHQQALGGRLQIAEPELRPGMPSASMPREILPQWSQPPRWQAPAKVPGADSAGWSKGAKEPYYQPLGVYSMMVV